MGRKTLILLELKWSKRLKSSFTLLLFSFWNPKTCRRLSTLLDVCMTYVLLKRDELNSRPTTKRLIQRNHNSSTDFYVRDIINRKRIRPRKGPWGTAHVIFIGRIWVICPNKIFPITQIRYQLYDWNTSNTVFFFIPILWGDNSTLGTVQ